MIHNGRIKPAALSTTVKENAVTALVDGNYGFGHVTGEYATRIAIAKAKAEGVGIVCGVHSNHIGRIGEYAEMAVATVADDALTRAAATPSRRPRR